MAKRWVVKPIGNTDEISIVANALNIDNVLANLLVQRGIKTFENAKSFFRPSLDDLHDPFLMKEMHDAVERLEYALSENQKILVYGDYDVDGTTSVAMVFSFLKKRHEFIEYYIPDRYGEGYGISYKAMDYAHENGFSLIIALDCGIKADKKVIYGKKLGIDFIICDHHNPNDVIPGAVAVLDPKRPDCNYPFKELSGCGVGFKLLQAFCIKNNIPLDELFVYLDILTVSIASDIVPIIDENRVLCHFGLKKLNSNPSIGLKSIMNLSGMNTEMCINDIVFRIGPRINAAGRINSGNRAVELLLAENEKEAFDFAEEINKFNTHRKDLDSSITLEALSAIKESDILINKKSTVLYKPEWHKGVLGIVASRLIETYYKPTVVLTQSDGLLTGSARSVPGFDLYKAIDSCNEYLENFGGHMYATGLTLKPENLDAFKDKFEKIVSETVSDEQLTPYIDIDSVLNFSEINSKFYRILKQFEPFGPENMRPVFLTKNVFDFGSSRIVGKEGEHLKLDLIQENDPYNVLSGIAFGQSEHFELINKKQPVDICYSIEENDFQGKVTLQLRIRDIRIAD
ncbi:MAG: single-stranded-DNA-specific exonuclease RecJ [Bacteroidetes bacterium GWA2_30_7]|nr:MAG: single-stranded-DNA-specific exonuclease RecJ [Bacteroidetes bacterium GWA2_30_7]